MLITAALAGQLLGAATQGLWHVLLTGRTRGLLTEDRAFWIDHTISNAGVGCLIVGSIRLHRRYPGLATRVLLAGAAAETLGALLDARAHAQGGENPIAFGLIGAGFLLAGGGSIAAWRARHGNTPNSPRHAPADHERGIH